MITKSAFANIEDEFNKCLSFHDRGRHYGFFTEEGACISFQFNIPCFGAMGDERAEEIIPKESSKPKWFAFVANGRKISRDLSRMKKVIDLPFIKPFIAQGEDEFYWNLAETINPIIVLDVEAGSANSLIIAAIILRSVCQETYPLFEWYYDKALCKGYTPLEALCIAGQFAYYRDEGSIQFYRVYPLGDFFPVPYICWDEMTKRFKPYEKGLEVLLNTEGPSLIEGGSYDAHFFPSHIGENRVAKNITYSDIINHLK